MAGSTTTGWAFSFAGILCGIILFLPLIHADILTSLPFSPLFLVPCSIIFGMVAVSSGNSFGWIAVALGALNIIGIIIYMLIMVKTGT
jgi:hypothetical protein